MKRLVQVLALNVSLVLGVYAVAGPSHYPESFQRMGIVDDIRQGAIVINDQFYYISNALKVHTAKKADKNRKVLRKGQTIGYSFQASGTGRRGNVTEIWILSSDMVKEYRK